MVWVRFARRKDGVGDSHSEVFEALNTHLSIEKEGTKREKRQRSGLQALPSSTLLDLELSLQLHCDARLADPDLEDSRFDPPGIHVVVPEADGVSPKRDGHRLALAGFEMNFGEALELLLRSSQGRDDVREVDLRGLRASDGASVGDLERYFHLVIGGEESACGRDLEVGVGESRVRQSVSVSVERMVVSWSFFCTVDCKRDEPEGEERLDVPLVVPSVADEESLRVSDVVVFGAKRTVGRDIFLPRGERQRELSAWIDLAKEDVGDGVSLQRKYSVSECCNLGRMQGQEDEPSRSR